MRTRGLATVLSRSPGIGPYAAAAARMLRSLLHDVLPLAVAFAALVAASFLPADRAPPPIEAAAAACPTIRIPQRAGGHCPALSGFDLALLRASHRAAPTPAEARGDTPVPVRAPSPAARPASPAP